MRQESIRRIISVGLLLALVIIFSVTTDNFFQLSNIQIILRDAGVYGIIGVGVTFVIITAGIDLSTGAVLGFSAMICARVLYLYQLPAGMIIVLALLLSTLCGFITGQLVSRLRLPDFIATLAMQFILQAFMLVFAIREDGVISNKVITNRTILLFGASIDGFYFVTFAFLIIAVIGQVILKRTKLGTYIYATGANLKSAQLSGINTGRIKRIVFTITGFLCGIGALFTMGRIGSVSTDIGVGTEFEVISAVVVGGCAFSGGRGDVIGTVIGAIFMAVLKNGILKYSLPTAAQVIVKGVVIIFVVMFDSIYNRYMEKRVLEKARQLDVEGGEA